MQSTDDVRRWLTKRLEGTAEWRRRSAEDFPADAARHREASYRTDELAVDVERLPDRAFLELVKLRDEAGDGSLVLAVENRMLRALGFTWTPETGAAFLAGLAAAVRQAIDAPLPVRLSGTGARGLPVVEAAATS